MSSLSSPFKPPTTSPPGSAASSGPSKTQIRDSLDGRRRLLGFLSLVLIAVLFLAFKQRGSFPDPDEVRPELLQPPIQTETTRKPFEMTYKKRKVSVEPLFEYELFGLVVSHNNIKSIADIYHDSSSVDTKDLCVVWGSNLQTGELDKVEFSSGPWTCYFRIPHGVKFEGAELSNSHLITDKASLREDLGDVRIGDQIRVKGALVNYQVDDWQDFWRRSSTRRNDTGDGACEVIFFEELEVMRAGTPFWYRLFNLCLFLLALVPALFLHSIWLDSKRLAEAAYTAPAFEGAAPDVWQGSVEG